MTDKEGIPAYLVERVQQGDVVVVLGAGASFGAKGPGGSSPPSGKGLGELLCQRFLGGEFKTAPLAQIADYCTSESSLLDVQRFIRDIFDEFKDTPDHDYLTKFRWWGLATTNYDLLVERAFDKGGIQKLRAIIANGDGVETSQRDTKTLVFLKLHGCITKISAGDPPLILTPDQYVRYKEKRSRLFDILQEWAIEKPVVFIGHSLQDPDIRELLLRLDESGLPRCRFYLVTPFATDVERRFWEQKRITVIKQGFREFIEKLDGLVAPTFRAVAPAKPDEAHPIAKRFTNPNAILSDEAKRFLEVEVDYLGSTVPVVGVSPEDFYKGSSRSWAPIEQGLDVRREVTDDVIISVFLKGKDAGGNEVQMFVIKAHAGSGKSVFMRRLAWDAAKEGALVLFLREYGDLSHQALEELCNNCDERVFVVIDDAGDHVKGLLRLLRALERRPRAITLVLSERTNEWNVLCEALESYVDKVFELPYLTPKEIHELLGLLEKHKSLKRLESLGPEERFAALSERAGRQILVALHEATLGLPFEEIIEDEFKHIEPDEARQIYLTICVLNRLRVPVRAGVVARLHGVNFEEFNKRFFAPLEHVVFTDYDKVSRDYVYRSRHTHIAEIVFSRCLIDPETRLAKYVRCLRALNIEYESDSRAFRQMVRGRVLEDMFADHSMIAQVFREAREHVGNNAYLSQQMGIYEMLRPEPNFEKAAKHLESASTLAPHDQSIRHSLSELHLKIAESSGNDLHRDFHLNRAGELARRITESAKSDTDKSFAMHTIAKIGIERIRAGMKSGSITLESMEGLVQEAERAVARGRQQYPGESSFHSAEAKLAALLSDSNRVMEALKQGFRVNPRNHYIAIRLGRVLKKSGDEAGFAVVMKKALEANPGNKELHAAMGESLVESPGYNHENALYHLHRGFTQGDSNYDTQFLYARELYLGGRFEDAGKLFDQLGKARVEYKLKVEPRMPAPGRFNGTVTSKGIGFAFLRRDDVPSDVFCRADEMDPNLWEALRGGSRVTFEIAFNLKGPVAANVARR